MEHSIYMTYEVYLSGRISIVDAFGVAHGDDDKSIKEVLHRIELMIKFSYPNLESIELKRVMIKDHKE